MNAACGTMRAVIPFRVDPVQPTLVKPFHRDGYVYEEKLDGWRIVAYKNGDRVRLVSRTNTEHSRTFPHLAAAIAAVPAEMLVLDGEVCAFDANLVSHMHLLRDPEPGEIATPP